MKRFLSGFLALVLGVGVTVNAYSNSHDKKPMQSRAFSSRALDPVDPEPEH